MTAVAETNATWRVNRTGMKQCCYATLQYEIYRRKDRDEELLKKGNTLICEKCKSEMICEEGISGRLRWGMKPTQN